MRRAALAAVACGLGLALVSGALADDLGVCLDDGAAPYSFRRKSGEGGFDLALAKALADRLGRSLKLQWFESEYEKESSLALDANALLSAGKCDLVAEFPLIAPALAKPLLETAPLPRHDGMGGKRSPRVPLGTLIASRAYHLAPLEIVVGPKGAARQVASLADLAGLRLGVRAGTLAGTILMAHGERRFADDIVELPLDGDLLAGLEAGQFDAALVERHRFDAYRARNPETALRASGYRHPIGFNMGFAALDRDKALIGDVNGAIAAMLADGTLARLGEAAGMTYVAPRAPEVLDRITPAMLLGN